jgi:hypothetical protein
MGIACEGSSPKGKARYCNSCVAMHVLVMHERERHVMVMYRRVSGVRARHVMVIHLRLRLVTARQVRVVHVRAKHVGQGM